MNTSNFLTIPAQMFPEQEALVFEGRRFTYGALLERVNRLAHALAARGVGPGDAVAVLQVNSNQVVEAYYAVSRLAATFVPLNFRARADELRYMLDTAEAKVLLVGDQYVGLINSLRNELPAVQHVIALDQPQEGLASYEDLLAAASPAEIEHEVADEATNILMYTSGTTALPKGVMLTYGDFSAYVLESVEPADGSDRGATLLCVPIYHVAGASAIMTALYGGRRLVLMRQFEPGAWLALVERERISHAFLVPTMLKRVLDHPDFDATDFGALQVLAYGAAPMPLPVIRRALERFPRHVQFLNAFGQTETTSTVTLLGPEDHRIWEGTPAERAKKLQRLTSIGRPIGDAAVLILDEQGVPLEPGQIGEIAIVTARAMKGYHKREAETAETLVEGMIRTRDMGWADEDGYIYLAGRKSDMIIRGGENIAPEEVETVLHTHPAVEECAVIGVADEEWGERVKAVVVLKPGAAATAEDLIAWCRPRLASFKRPEAVEFVAALPRNPMGKLLKKDIRAQYGQPAPRAPES